MAFPSSSHPCAAIAKCEAGGCNGSILVWTRVADQGKNSSARPTRSGNLISENFRLTLSLRRRESAVLCWPSLASSGPMLATFWQVVARTWPGLAGFWPGRMSLVWKAGRVFGRVSAILFLSLLTTESDPLQIQDVKERVDASVHNSSRGRISVGKLESLFGTPAFAQLRKE